MIKTVLSYLKNIHHLPLKNFKNTTTTSREPLIFLIIKSVIFIENNVTISALCMTSLPLCTMPSEKNFYDPFSVEFVLFSGCISWFVLRWQKPTVLFNCKIFAKQKKNYYIKKNSQWAVNYCKQASGNKYYELFILHDNVCV